MKGSTPEYLRTQGMQNRNICVACLGREDFLTLRKLSAVLKEHGRVATSFCASHYEAWK